jgi:hypothetical protein
VTFHHSGFKTPESLALGLHDDMGASARIRTLPSQESWMQRGGEAAACAQSRRLALREDMMAGL